MRSHVFGCKYRHKSDNLQGFYNFFFEKCLKNHFSTVFLLSFYYFKGFLTVLSCLRLLQRLMGRRLYLIIIRTLPILVFWGTV